MLRLQAGVELPHLHSSYVPLLKTALLLQDLYSQLVGNDTLDLSKQDVIQGLISQWKDKFCTEAVYTPASKNPASFTGTFGCRNPHLLSPMQHSK